MDLNLATLPLTTPWGAAWYFFVSGGWILFVAVLLWAAQEYWLNRQRSRYFARWDWVVLAIHIPKNIEQSPKAVEHIFATLAGTWKKIDWIERWLTGKVQVKFSFEIASHQGNLSFYIHCPRHYRDLVEAAIYAQYPTAEIAEVPDYTEPYRRLHWPDRDGGYDIWGTKMKLMRKEFFPIRTWEDFGGGKDFKDPLMTVLESMAKLRAGEEFWFQLVLTPIDNHWKEKGLNYVRQLSGQKVKNPSIGGQLGAGAVSLVDAAVAAFIPPFESEGEVKKPEPIAKEQEAVKAIQEKLAKIAFKTNIRVVYLAKQEVFNRHRVRESFLGALHQFTNLYTNGFIQDKLTKVSKSHLYYFRQYRLNHRKNRIFYTFRTRSYRSGKDFGTGMILNVQELASLWHFPLGELKTLMIKQVDTSKAEAPFGLPTDLPEGDETITFGDDTDSISPTPETVHWEDEDDDTPPDNLPTE